MSYDITLVLALMYDAGVIVGNNITYINCFDFSLVSQYVSYRFFG